jgi:hypothetical protein
MSVVPSSNRAWHLYHSSLCAVGSEARDGQGKTVLVSSHLFQEPQFVVGATITAILSLALAGTSFSLPIFFQGVRNLDAFHTGLAMLPMSLALLSWRRSRPTSQAYYAAHYHPSRARCRGLGLPGTGTILKCRCWRVEDSAGIAFVWRRHGIHDESGFEHYTLSAVPVREAGEASGVNGTMRQLGGALGAAILGAIVLSVSPTQLRHGVPMASIVHRPQISLYTSIAFVLVASVIKLAP